MDVPAQIALRVGDIREVRLPGHATAGYEWDYTTSGPNDVLDILLGEAGPEPRREEAATLRPGYNRDQQVTLKALRPGHVTLDLELRQPWDPTTPPLEQHHIAVTVKRQDAR